MKTASFAPTQRRNILFPESIQPYFSGVWTDDETLMFPAFSVSADERYTQFLTVQQDEETQEWSLIFQDLFIGGGADGDSESFATYDEACQAASNHLKKWHFTIVSTL